MKMTQSASVFSIGVLSTVTDYASEGNARAVYTGAGAARAAGRGVCAGAHPSWALGGVVFSEQSELAAGREDVLRGQPDGGSEGLDDGPHLLLRVVLVVQGRGAPALW